MMRTALLRDGDSRTEKGRSVRIAEPQGLQGLQEQAPSAALHGKASRPVLNFSRGDSGCKPAPQQRAFPALTAAAGALRCRSRGAAAAPPLPLPPPPPHLRAERKALPAAALGPPPASRGGSSSRRRRRARAPAPLLSRYAARPSSPSAEADAASGAAPLR